MVSRFDYVQARRDYDVAVQVLLLVVIVIGGSITQSSATVDDTKVKVRDERQLENEWASTSKRDHKGPNTYEFRYDVENAPTNNVQYRMEERHPNGSVVGSYGQVQPDGNIKVVSYVADKDGMKTYVKNSDGKTGGGDQYVAAGSSLDPVQRVTSQIIQTAVQSQQNHKSPLHDKYHRPTPAASNHRVDSAHAYHQQRTNVDPSTFRPEDSPGYQETNQPFVGDQLKNQLHSSYAEYRVPSAPQQAPSPALQQQQAIVQSASPILVQNAVSPLPPVAPYSLQGPLQPTQQQQQPSHYMLNVPPLPSLADNSPLPLLPGQQPLPITPDRGPIMIQLQQPQQPQQQQNYQYQSQPTQVYQQQLRLPPGQAQQQFVQPSQAQLYQQQPVRVQPPVHLQQQQQQQVRLVPQQQQVQYQPNQQARAQLAANQQYQQQQQQKVPYQQSVMQQQYPQQVNIPAHPSQLQVRGTVQQQQTVVPMQYFHQPNPATTVEQYRQQLQLQAAESQLYPVFVLPPSGTNVFDFKGKRFRF